MLGCENPGARKTQILWQNLLVACGRCVFIYIHMCIYIYVYVYIYTIFLERYTSFRFEETYLACIMLIGCR